MSKFSNRSYSAFVLSIIVCVTAVLSNFPVLAQVANETISLAGGESQIVTIDFPFKQDEAHYHDIGVFHKGGGDLGGFTIEAKARGTFSNSYCMVQLSISAGNYDEIKFDQSDDWSDWVSVPIPHGTNVAIVMLEAGETTVFGGCGEGTMEVKIRLIGDEPITMTPSRTPPPIITLTPSRTITPSITPKVETEAAFWADDYDIKFGECTIIRWDVTGAKEVYWWGEPTYPAAYIEMCPNTTTTYILQVVDQDMNWHDHELTIYVDIPPTTTPRSTASQRPPTVTPRQPTSTPMPTQPPAPTGCDPIGRYGVILIVTDSDRLAYSTGDADSWSRVKDALENYYGSAVVDCDGSPVFLDLATIYPNTNYSHHDVKRAIETEVRRLNLFYDNQLPLGALLIVGGVGVVPMPQIHDFTSLGSQFFSDDPYADLNNDRWMMIDTVIARLPDGHSTNAMLDHIYYASTGIKPNEGGVILASPQISAHRLNLRPNYLDATILEGADQYIIDEESLLNIDDILKARTGSATYLLSPIWSKWQMDPAAIDPNLIRMDDGYNAIQIIGNDTSVSTKIFERDLLLYYLIPGPDNSAWYAKNAPENAPLITAYDVVEAGAIKPGTNVFAMVPSSAFIPVTDKVNSSIPLTLLSKGARNFIGLTSSLAYSTKDPHTYDNGKVIIADIDISKLSAAFARYYYQWVSGDPATSFFLAKSDFAAEKDLSDPWNYKTYHSFIYYGVPEKGRYLGIYQGADQIPLPAPTFNPLPRTSKCPSGVATDCDGDGMDESLEAFIAQSFMPSLIFHPGDGVFRSGRERPFEVYWQVTPTILDDINGAFLTLVVTYPEDYGFDELDINKLSDKLKCYGFATLVGCTATSFIGAPGLGCITAPALMTYALNSSNLSTGLLGHVGDSEAIRMFVYPNSEGSWTVRYIDFKRHFEGFGDEEDPIPVAKLIGEGLRFKDGSHPILYVAQHKHAMYPTKKACEDATWHFEGTTCTVNPEDCGADPWFDTQAPVGIPISNILVPADHNVGEFENDIHVVIPDLGSTQKTFPRMDKLPEYLGEYAWHGINVSGHGEKEFFCGALSPSSTLLDEPCAGSLRNMWFDPLNDPYRDN